MLEPTLIVIIELPEPGAAIGFGAKLTVVPLGAPEVDSVIELLKPPEIVLVMVDVPCVPCTTLNDDGDADRVKFAVEVTVNVVLPLIVPDAAWIVEEPAATPVAKPPLAMVATEVLLEVQVALLVRS